jgi:uncharacterized protein with HEPN domain
MSPRDWVERIRDILDAIVEIQAFTVGMDYEAFEGDAKTIRAVELDFIVIGEATNQLPDDIEKGYPEIPWSLMRAMRNRLVHVYFAVDPRLLWDTVQNDLPLLIPPLEAVISQNK